MSNHNPILDKENLPNYQLYPSNKSKENIISLTKQNINGSPTKVIESLRKEKRQQDGIILKISSQSEKRKQLLGQQESEIKRLFDLISVREVSLNELKSKVTELQGELRGKDGENSLLHYRLTKAKDVLKLKESLLHSTKEELTTVMQQQQQGSIEVTEKVSTETNTDSQPPTVPIAEQKQDENSSMKFEELLLHWSKNKNILHDLIKKSSNIKINEELEVQLNSSCLCEDTESIHSNIPILTPGFALSENTSTANMLNNKVDEQIQLNEVVKRELMKWIENNFVESLSKLFLESFNNGGQRVTTPTNSTIQQQQQPMNEITQSASQDTREDLSVHQYQSAKSHFETDPETDPESDNDARYHMKPLPLHSNSATPEIRGFLNSCSTPQNDKYNLAYVDDKATPDVLRKLFNGLDEMPLPLSAGSSRSGSMVEELPMIPLLRPKASTAYYSLSTPAKKQSIQLKRQSLKSAVHMKPFTVEYQHAEVFVNSHKLKYQDIEDDLSMCSSVKSSWLDSTALSTQVTYSPVTANIAATTLKPKDFKQHIQRIRSNNYDTHDDINRFKSNIQKYKDSSNVSCRL